MAGNKQVKLYGKSDRSRTSILRGKHPCREYWVWKHGKSCIVTGQEETLISSVSWWLLYWEVWFVWYSANLFSCSLLIINLLFLNRNFLQVSNIMQTGPMSLIWATHSFSLIWDEVQKMTYWCWNVYRALHRALA